MMAALLVAVAALLVAVARPRAAAPHIDPPCSISGCNHGHTRMVFLNGIMYNEGSILDNAGYEVEKNKIFFYFRVDDRSIVTAFIFKCGSLVNYGSLKRISDREYILLTPDEKIIDEVLES